MSEGQGVVRPAMTRFRHRGTVCKRHGIKEARLKRAVEMKLGSVRRQDLKI